MQETLRHQAEPRFGDVAQRMAFTRQGLEQASRPLVAARRSARLAAHGFERFVDLGCGIGVDSMAARRAGLAICAFERDRDLAAIARWNIALAGSAPFRVLVADVTSDADAAGAGPGSAPGDPLGSRARTAWFVDPARRSGHRPDGTAVRVMRPDAWQPPWRWVLELAEQKGDVVAKVAPGIPHERIPAGAAVEWVSVAGTVVEATVWFGDVAGHLPARAAVLMQPSATPWTAAGARMLAGVGGTRQAQPGPMATWLLEPDPAVIRGHLLAELCDRVAGHLLSPGIAYVTSGDRPDATFGRVDRVVDVLPAQPRRLRQELRRRGIGSVEIRTRGLALRPEALRRELRLDRSGPPASLVVTRVAGRPATLLVTRT